MMYLQLWNLSLNTSLHRIRQYKLILGESLHTEIVARFIPAAFRVYRPSNHPSGFLVKLALSDLNQKSARRVKRLTAASRLSNNRNKVTVRERAVGSPPLFLFYYGKTRVISERHTCIC